MARKTPRPRVTVASSAAGDAPPRLGQRGQARASLDGVLKKNLRRSVTPPLPIVRDFMTG
jgi:hypothetical protein